MADLKEFLARQLNDHAESVRGVRQGTFFTWNESHVEQAIRLGITFLYDLIPEEFSEIREYIIETEDCLVSFCDQCNKFMGVIDLQIDDNTCIELTERPEDDDQNCLIGLLSNPCYSQMTCDEEEKEYFYTRVSSSNCMIKFDEPLPVGSVIRYNCSRKPDLDDLESDSMLEFHPIIAEFAMWWLYRTDSESRSNLTRAQLHFESLQYLVKTKLQTEFSMSEDDYAYGQRKVDDN